MDRTLRAAGVAAVFGLVVVGGIAWFLGIPSGTALVSGLVAAGAFGGLIILAARRAERLGPSPSTADDRHPEDPTQR